MLELYGQILRFRYNPFVIALLIKPQCLDTIQCTIQQQQESTELISYVDFTTTATLMTVTLVSTHPFLLSIFSCGLSNCLPGDWVIAWRNRLGRSVSSLGLGGLGPPSISLFFSFAIYRYIGQAWLFWQIIDNGQIDQIYYQKQRLVIETPFFHKLSQKILKFTLFLRAVVQ